MTSLKGEFTVLLPRESLHEWGKEDLWAAAAGEKELSWLQMLSDRNTITKEYIYTYIYIYIYIYILGI